MACGAWSDDDYIFHCISEKSDKSSEKSEMFLTRMDWCLLISLIFSTSSYILVYQKSEFVVW